MVSFSPEPFRIQSKWERDCLFVCLFVPVIHSGRLKCITDTSTRWMWNEQRVEYFIAGYRLIHLFRSFERILDFVPECWFPCLDRIGEEISWIWYFQLSAKCDFFWRFWYGWSRCLRFNWSGWNFLFSSFTVWNISFQFTCFVLVIWFGTFWMNLFTPCDTQLVGNGPLFVCRI